MVISKRYKGEKHFIVRMTQLKYKSYQQIE